MKYFKKIKGKKIYLSPINVEDYEKYCEWLNDEEISNPLGVAARAYTLDNEKEILKKIANSSHEHHFAIINEQSNELLGNISLAQVNNIHQKATLGIFIGDAKNRGKGYGKEAIELLLNYGFNYLNLHNVMLKVYEFNSNAIGLYEKIGFKYIGRRKEAYYLNGKRYDELFMEILKKEN